MRIFAAFVVLPLFLGGCAAIDPSIAQLERFQSATKDGRLRDIANEPVAASCAADQADCGRRHALKADACLSLAMAARAQGAACPAASPVARSDLDCAAAAYAAAMALAGAGFSSAELVAHRRGRVQALYCRAELDTPAGGAVLAREALNLSAALPPPDRDTFGGSAALFLARPGAGTDAARCDGAREAARRARDGLAVAQAPGDRAILTRLAADAEARRLSIAGCGP